MPKQPRQPAPAPHPDVAAGGIRRTRYYLHCFIDTLRETGHQPEHVRQVLQELLAGTSGVTAVHPMRDGYTGSVMDSGPESGHKLAVFYATREQAEAAKAWLASGVTRLDGAQPSEGSDA